MSSASYDHDRLVRDLSETSQLLARLNDNLERLEAGLVEERNGLLGIPSRRALTLVSGKEGDGDGDDD